MTGDHDRDHLRVGLQTRMQQVQTRNVAHVEVDERDVEGGAAEQLERFAASTTDGDVVAFEPEDAGAAFAQSVVVVNDYDAKAGLQLGADDGFFGAWSFAFGG